MTFTNRINSTTHQLPGNSCCWLQACVQAIGWHPGHGERLPVAEPLGQRFHGLAGRFTALPCTQLDYRLDLERQSLRSI